ncbi:MAG: putative bifunctional diguanylate cyclase/phosphodiesterase [Actinomycetota bacterium]
MSAPTRARSSAVLIWVAAMVVVFASLTYLVGGTSSLPPHWFYLPIVIAGARFGVPGAVVVALASGLLVGPVMPADVVQGTAQETSDWLTRTFFFAGIGVMVTALMRQAARGIERERRQVASAKRLDDALSHEQLHLHFQPIVSAATGEVTGAEALLRWETPERGLIPPETFVPVAEATGHIIPIGSWVLDEACSQLRAWGKILGDVPVVMSVNVSAVQLDDGNLVALVHDTLDRHGLEPASLCLEITETSLMPNLDESAEVLQDLRDLGVSVAIDDFGKGLSSLSYLRSLPFDTIKIDGQFLEHLGKKQEAGTLVDSIVRMGEDLDKTTVAERVETALQWERVVASGCTHGQGYLFAPPLPQAAFLALLASRQVWPADQFRSNGSY